MNSILFILSFGVLWISVSRYTCYQISVTVNDDEQTKRAKLEIVDREIPPFEVPATDGAVRNMFQDHEPAIQQKNNVYFSESGREVGTARVRLRGKTRSGLLYNARVKRSSKWCNMTEKVSKAVSVAKDGVIHLPCHRCLESANELYEPMQWVKLHPNPDRNGLYLVKEILSDMHDDEKRNKLIISLDHTLIIRKARRSNTGSYICKPFTQGEFLRKRLNWTGLQKWITEISQMRYFYHLDVIDFDEAPMVESGGNSGRMMMQSHDMVPENLIIYTKWLPWSSCSVCDQHGLRQRIGLCVIKKRHGDLTVPHAYLNNILDFARNGLPCQSEFLKEFDNSAWFNRPNEIEFSECFEPCPKRKRRKKRSTISIKELSEDVEKKKKKKVISIQVNQYLILKCPGSKILKKPVWMLGSRTISPVRIRNVTKKRVNFDIFGSLHFIKTKLNDSGMYSCWIEKKLKRKFDVRVHASPFKDVVKYGWLLGLSLFLDFLIFLCLTTVKCCHRRVQVRKKSNHKRQKIDGQK